MVNLNNGTTNKVTSLPNNTSTDVFLDALVKLDALIHNTPITNASSLDTSTDMFSGASRNNTPTTNPASLDTTNTDVFLDALRKLDTLIHNTPTTNVSSLKEYDKIKQTSKHMPHALKWTTLALLIITILLTTTIVIFSFIQDSSI